MSPADFRVEGNNPLSGRMGPASGSPEQSFNDRAVAVTTGAKSVTTPSGREIQVVHVPTGEVIFRKLGVSRVEFTEED
jgi:hypothetical protein